MVAVSIVLAPGASALRVLDGVDVGPSPAGGSADPLVDASLTGEANGVVAVSVRGHARGVVAASVAGDATAERKCLGLNAAPACPPPLLATTGGDTATGPVAVSGTGESVSCERGPACVAATGTGHASGNSAVSALGTADGRTVEVAPCSTGIPPSPPCP